MRTTFRYLAALTAELLLVCAALATMIVMVAHGRFAGAVTGTPDLLTLQQERIDREIRRLEETWSITPGLLTTRVQGAAEAHNAALTQWWDALWTDPEADTAMPVWLDETQERALIGVLLVDDGFRSATSVSTRRATARDEVAYELDEAVCKAVNPLRRSVLEAGLEMAVERISLPMIRNALMIFAAVAAVLALALMIAAHRLAGSALISAGIVVALIGGLVCLLDLQPLMAALNPAAEMIYRNALQLLGMIWYGLAVLLAVIGAIICMAKRAMESRK